MLLFSPNKLISCTALGQRGRDQAASELLIQINILSGLICKRPTWSVSAHVRGTAHCSLLVWEPLILASPFFSTLFLTQVCLPGNGATFGITGRVIEFSLLAAGKDGSICILNQMNPGEPSELTKIILLSE